MISRLYFSLTLASKLVVVESDFYFVESDFSFCSSFFLKKKNHFQVIKNPVCFFFFSTTGKSFLLAQ